MARVRVLILEEDPLLREFLTQRLSGEGYEVDAVSEAAERDRSSFDIVVSHIQKPFQLDRLLARLQNRAARFGPGRERRCVA